ncbi:MAG TPA: SDR family NAD(P)-dependent oxidoreductase [Treponemataceae bacterium]|nr:SDR family NAD(P)-dependent oxidoreductase [Treponemataceae bacterium]
MDYKKWLNENIGDLSGKIYIVTGATGTLGTEIMRNLLYLNASVIMAVRNIEKAHLLIANFKKNSSTSFVRAYALDLTSFSSIETFCEEMISEYTHIDAQ